MENSRFEESFRDAFSGAEVAPAEGVWTNIELSLEKASGGKMKRNLLLFQLLAAASVAFACGIAALYYINNQSIRPDQTGEQAVVKKEVLTPQRNQSTTADNNNTEKSNPAKSPVQSNLVQRKADSRHSGSNSGQDEMAALAHDNSEPKNNQTEQVFEPRSIERRSLSDYASVGKPELVLPKPEQPVEADPGMVLLAKLKDEEKKYQEEENKKSKENIWASVGVGAGSYRPNREVVTNDNVSSSKGGASYSAGLNVAGRISRRLVLQGGISYLSQSADFVSTSANKGGASLSEYVRPSLSNEGSAAGAPVSSYTVNSSLQFVSVPVQAGYVILDQAFSIQLNGGVATDLFISNTLIPDDKQLQKVTQTAGKDSPYRTVTFSGLLGTEFSYRIANQYRISLNPGLRYSLSSIYKDEIAARITPVTFDVSLRFRYIFK
ncbi:MAG TPA: outer membrane beta-barrel protein [Cyclobacteriaceae bacterium]|nr:outer membrane beta-barrel protein [Cyclobacteriaceae bacterium]HMV08900.1 outer membrane beta-barrel protein [Cyclobacteriaceae bacterium]HMV90365.1 outer membrane beta-barrel protein [Cyclobacteriaceae bacterium]HMX00345.1 outer membrane beta-barrel protein [Cyclobacteriaceae bacterium]HMX49656.1 outer membrane beta-barrel protein [Cyclobacteriaceae bacterium]